MKNWQIDLFAIGEDPGASDEVVFAQISRASEDLGFEYCSYGYQAPLPCNRPKTVILSNYADEWTRRYERENYLCHDPAVKHCRKSEAPFVWKDEPIQDAGQMWEAARAFGLRYGWAQSCLSVTGGAGMLTLSRSAQALTTLELDAAGQKMRWLASVSHFILSRRLTQNMRAATDVRLTDKEVEVMKWSADGKTSGEIAQILSISDNTVNFHVKNVIQKLQVANKTAAVVHAALMGLLN